jgi:hypothetical protein
MVDGERTVLVEVVDIFAVPSFAALEQRLLEIDLLGQDQFSPTGMQKYYLIENEEKYGIMGVMIRVVSPVSTEM